MKIRRLAEAEYKQATIIDSIAFEYAIDYEKLIKEQDNPQQDSVNGFETDLIGAFDEDNKTLLGKISAYPYQVNYDQNLVMLRGIGGVATLPQHRKKGIIRKCFLHQLERDYEKGFLFSYLYPFQRSFYRNFGYESNSFDRLWNIDFTALRSFDTKGRVELLMPEDSHEVLQEVYGKMYQRYNLRVQRKKDDFAYYYERGSFTNRRFAYVWYNQEGEAKSYMIFRKENIEGKNMMDCTHNFWSKNDFVFADLEGLKGLLDFASSFAADYQGIRFAVPNDCRIEGILYEGNRAKSEEVQSGMVRVLRVEDVLRCSKYLGAGEVRMSITDTYLPENEACYYIKFENNQCIELRKEEGLGDVSMDISTFSALILGTYPSIKQCWKEDLKLQHENPDLDKVFYSKPNKMANLF